MNSFLASPPGRFPYSCCASTRLRPSLCSGCRACMQAGADCASRAPEAGRSVAPPPRAAVPLPHPVRARRAPVGRLQRGACPRSRALQEPPACGHPLHGTLAASACLTARRQRPVAAICGSLRSCGISSEQSQAQALVHFMSTPSAPMSLELCCSLLSHSEHANLSPCTITFGLPTVPPVHAGAILAGGLAVQWSHCRQSSGPRAHTDASAQGMPSSCNC